MRKGILFFSLLAAPLCAQTTAPVQQESVGVYPVKTLVQAGALEKGTLDRLAKQLESQLVADLVATRKFKVVTRQDLDTVLKEQDLAASGNVDAEDAAKVAQRFKLAGAGSALQVTVNEFQDRVERFHSSILDQTVTKRSLRVGVAVALLDTTTGAVRENVSIPPLTERDLHQKLSQVRDSALSGEELTGELARQLSKRVAERLTEVMFPARVLSRTGEVVLINRGDGTGIATGQEWAVYATGEALVAPDTGENLGADEVFIGRVIITEVQPKFARAKVVKDQGIARGQIARLAASSEKNGKE